MALDVKISFSWTNYCRLCLMDTGIMLPLFEGEGQIRQVGHKVEACLQLVTYDGDPLPRRICHTCLYKVNQMYEFRTMALSSYDRLKTHLLPLKHVPEVQQYLDRVDQLQRPMKLNTTPCSTPASADSRTVPARIRIKSERELMEGPPNCSPWSSLPCMDPVTPKSPFSSASCNSTPLASLSREPTPSLDSGNVQQDSLKRKRFCLAPDSSSREALEKNVSPVLKKVKRKKQLAGPASRKRHIQNSQWKCVFCLSQFASKSSLNIHIEKCLRCGTCHKEFSSVAEKAIHEADKHMLVLVDCEKKYLRRRCSRCPARYVSSVMLSMHSKFDHPSSKKPSTNHQLAKVSEKDNIAASSSQFVHEEIKDDYNIPNGEIQCNGTRENGDGSLLRDADSMSTAKREPSDKVLSHCCFTCNESFLSAPMLLNHEKIIHGRFRCSLCTESFDSQKGLSSHKRSHISKRTGGSTVKKMSEEKKKPLTCHTCFEEFDEEDPFILHLYRHATEQSDDEIVPTRKPKKVQSKPKTSVSSAVSKSTTASSSDGSDSLAEQFSVKCERCHVVCRSKEYYKVHLATHVSKAKTSFPCSGCNQDFRNVEALNRHTCCGKQSDDMQTCCLDCGQALVKSEDHVCDNKCPECDKVFKSSRGQRLHFVSKHRSSIPVEDGYYEDAQLLALETNSLELEEDNTEPVLAAKPTENEDSPPADQSKSESGELEVGSFIAGSPPTERLPPDGAPLDEPYLFHSVPNNTALLTTSNDSDFDQVARPVSEKLVHSLPTESNLGLFYDL